MNFNVLVDKYKKSDLARRFADGTFWSLLSGLSYNVSMLIVGIILSHILGKYYYGQYGMVRSTINMFIVFSSFALGTTATKYIAEYRLKDLEKTRKIINLSLISTFILAFVVFLLCFVFSEHIAVHSLNTRELIRPLHLGSFMILFLTTSGVINGILVGFEEFFCVFKQNIISVLFLISGSAAGAYFGGVDGALCGLLLYLFVMFIIGLYYLRKTLRKYSINFGFKNISDEISILWKFSLPAAFGGFLCTPIYWVANTILVNSPAGYGAMAGFDIIRQWQSTVIFIPSVTGRVVLPLLSNLNSAEDSGRYKKIFKYSLFFNTGSALAVALLLSGLSGLLLSMYGKTYLEFKAAFFIMMMAGVISVANSIIGQIILSKDHAWYGFIFNALWAVVFLFFNFLFVKNMNLGTKGICLSYLMSYLFHIVIQSVFSYVILAGDKKRGAMNVVGKL